MTFSLLTYFSVSIQCKMDRMAIDLCEKKDLGCAEVTNNLFACSIALAVFSQLAGLAVSFAPTMSYPVQLTWGLLIPF